MHFAILCLITIPATMQAGPLPKLRYRPPRWNRLRPIKILQTSKEAFHIPESRRFDTLLHFEKPDLNSRKSFDDEPDMNEDGTINNIGMGQFTRKNGALKENHRPRREVSKETERMRAVISAGLLMETVLLSTILVNRTSELRPKLSE
ncbi:uncharacterized protein LOC133531348 isoform X2 [Cydia pomonella]|uniref:uncharacterized protein LOC133531348 isoform X2 n=1 Tax=Cydia pomonella TaxID=82600 RepID=UPI002ADE0829|nr:uncharacterized protein LOC133531348 isoform X2 [Cydia pomonella]